MSAFWISLGMVFLAELGDKTQLVALCFASRFKALTVLAGVFAATLVVHVLSVVLGEGAGSLLPQQWIDLIAGLAFLGFGLWTLRGDDLDDDSCNSKQGKSAFWIVASTFFLAELGDKTMLSTVALAAQYKAPVIVWLGSSLGMVVSDGLAIAVGRILGTNLPERAVKTGAAVIFFCFAAYKGVVGGMKLPLYVDVIAITLSAAAIAVFVLTSRRRAVPVEEPAAELKQPDKEYVLRD